jgi:hypothetical protein
MDDADAEESESESESDEEPVQMQQHPVATTLVGATLLDATGTVGTILLAATTTTITIGAHQPVEVERTKSAAGFTYWPDYTEQRCQP